MGTLIAADASLIGHPLPIETTKPGSPATSIALNRTDATPDWTPIE